MADNLFSKIKKTFNFLSPKPEENLSKNLEQNNPEKLAEQIGDIESNLLNNTTTINNNDSSMNTDSLLIEKKDHEILKFNYNEDISSSLKNLLKNDKELIYCCIVNKKEFSVTASYSKKEVENEFIIYNVNNLLSFISNGYIEKIINIEGDNLIERILTINDNNSQYVNIIKDEIIILITNQKNQLLTWTLMNEIKECILL